MGNPTLIPYPLSARSPPSILVNRLPLAQPAINARAHGDNEKDKENVERIESRTGMRRECAPWCAKYTHARVSPCVHSHIPVMTHARGHVCTRVGGSTPSLLRFYRLSIRSLGRKCITHGIVRLVIRVAR